MFRILIFTFVCSIPLFLFFLLNFYTFAWGFIAGSLVGMLNVWLYQFIFKRNHNIFFPFSSKLFQKMLSFDGIESFYQQVLSYFPNIKNYQFFILNNKEITCYPKNSLILSKKERQILEFYTQQALYKPFRIEQSHSFILHELSRFQCHAYAYTIPFFNKRILILVYTDKSLDSILQEQIKTINDLILIASFLEEFSRGHEGVFELLREIVWDSPYAIGFTNPLGQVEVGNDALYHMFQGDVPNLSELIGKEVFLMLLDGKRVGQSFMLHGKRVRVEAFPIANKNFLITKCFFIFVDAKLESQRELLDEANTLKRFTSGSSIVGAAMFTQDGLILYSNEAFMKSLDVFKVREATQKNIFELFDITVEVFNNIVHQILNGEEHRITLLAKESEEEFLVLFKGIVFGDKTIVEVVLEDNTIYHDNMAYLDKETETLYEELKTAQSIQEHILTLPTIYRPGVYINTLYKPAHQLSGDFFTILPLKDDKMGVLIADVSGHGISASLITAALKILIEFVPSDAESLPKIMAYFNTYLAGILPEGSFVTLFYGIIDYKEHTLQYINSGHPFPLLEDMDKNEVKVLEGMGYPLGGVLNVSFDELVYTIQLPKKCRLILYTDGLFQHMSGTMKDKFGEMSYIIDNNKHLNDQSLLELLYVSLATRTSTLPDDDVSMMLISMDENHTHKHHLYISSSLLEVDTVIEQIGSYIQMTANLSQSQYWKLHTCFYEALLNAVVHGNKYNTQKKVYIEFRIVDEGLIVLRIRDEGQGFDYHNLPDPFDSENILKDYGRGIQMVKSLANKVRFNKKGNEVTIFLKFSKEK